MTAGQQRIQEQRIYVLFKVSAVHLDTEFIAKDERNRQNIVSVVILGFSLRIQHDLFQ